MEYLELLMSLGIRACLLAGTAALAIRLVRMRGVAARHAVWTAVLFGMLLQAALTPLLPPLPLRVLRAPKDASLTTQRIAPAPPMAPKAGTAKWNLRWEHGLLFLYGAGIIFFLTRLGIGYVFARRIARTSSLLPFERGDVYESARIFVPMTTGWLNPRILLPGNWREWSPEKLQAVLAHEDSHIQRKDWLISLLARGNRALFWFHPLAWWLERHLNDQAEDACDEAAILRLGDRSQYARVLVEIARDLHAGRGRFVPVATAMAREADVKRRIDSILDDSRPLGSKPGRQFRIALVLTAMVCIYVTASARLATAQTAEKLDGTPYTKWLNEDVAYIVEDAERSAFQSLQSDPERDQFILQFWLRRDPTQGTDENEYKQEHYRRISYSNSRFRDPSGVPGWKTDRGRVYIQNGPPDEIESHPSGGPLELLTKVLGPLPYPVKEGSGFEIWWYTQPNLYIGFVDQNRTGAYQVIYPDSRLGILQSRNPEYTDAARAAGIQGFVTLKVTVLPDGSARASIIKSLDPGLDQKAIECIRGWRFRPAFRAGQPVPEEMELILSFRLPR